MKKWIPIILAFIAMLLLITVSSTSTNTSQQPALKKTSPQHAVAKLDS